MTFTYTLDPANDVTRVRFHTGDTDETTAKWSDEEIQFVIDENAGAWKKAVIQLLQGLVAEMARTPNFTADWLRVDAQSARAALADLLNEKRRELGVSTITARAVHTYRADSFQTDADYTE
jgi:hypothetical protein